MSGVWRAAVVGPQLSSTVRTRALSGDGIGRPPLFPEELLCWVAHVRRSRCRRTSPFESTIPACRVLGCRRVVGYFERPPRARALSRTTFPRLERRQHSASSLVGRLVPAPDAPRAGQAQSVFCRCGAVHRRGPPWASSAVRRYSRSEVVGCQQPRRSLWWPPRGRTVSGRLPVEPRSPFRTRLVTCALQAGVLTNHSSRRADRCAPDGVGGYNVWCVAGRRRRPAAEFNR